MTARENWMKSRLALLLMAFGVFWFSMQVLAAGVWPGERTFGPYSCPSCPLLYPAPDSLTLATIREADRYDTPIFMGASPGDKFVICNSTHCVTYQMTNSEQWLGVAREPLVDSGSGPGGGGSSAGGTAAPRPGIIIINIGDIEDYEPKDKGK